MGLITERGGGQEYETITIPQSATGPGSACGAMLRRRSARPSRRAALYLHCARDSFAPEDLVSWYTERGFHFYAADLRPDAGQEPPDGRGRRPLAREECFAGLDAACRYLKGAEGIDTVVLGAHAAGALTAALWCDARRADGPVDALILTSPELGRRLRHGLKIDCPVLVMSSMAGPDPGERPARVTARLRRGNPEPPVRLGPHVTWLRLADGLAAAEPSAGADRRRFFDEMGRWLGAYMYGQVRDQLL